jgi:hypothetical protein
MYLNYSFAQNNNKGGEIMNKLITPNSKKALENLKYEIAKELNINLGADQTSRLNGTVGGNMTKRLVELGREYYSKTESTSP